MARTVLSVALLACLGLAVLQLVSAEQEKQELEATSNEAVQAKAEDVEFRVLRDADAKRRRSGKNKGRKQARKGGKGKSKKAKKGKGGKKGRKEDKKNGKKATKGKGSKKHRKGGKEKNKKTKKGGKKGSIGNTRNNKQTCTLKQYKDAGRNFRRYSNNLRQLKRLTKTCERMANKENKSAEFNTSGEAPGTKDSTDPDVVLISSELQNCTTEVKKNCKTGSLTECNKTATDIVVCTKLLEAWITKYSGANDSCLNGADDKFCTCIDALPNNPPAACLGYQAIENKLKPQKKKCLSDAKGSFGACRKLQIKASDYCGKKKTSSTTAGSAGRRMMIRKNLMKKWIKN